MITEHAVRTLGLPVGNPVGNGPLGWLITTPRPLTTTQVAAARQSAAAVSMTVESKNSLPTSGEVVDYATGAALLIALFVLAMSIGLIRAETAGDRRTLAAAGASAPSLSGRSGAGPGSTRKLATADPRASGGVLLS